jgi:hypothetical protein
MIKEIVFPTNRKYRYYNLHFKYVQETILAAGIRLEKSKSVGQIGGSAFDILIDGKRALIDFSDFPRLLPEHNKYDYYFKFHYTKELHKTFDHVYPFGPISFENWTHFSRFKSEINYTATSDIVLNNQRPYAGAKERRNTVQRMLNGSRNQVDTKLTSQAEFWRKINNCLVSVCVPGARNNMLDRGQIQYMALGCCTISPKLQTVLPQYQKLLPDKHYIQCADDYSDLLKKIEWCKSNREKCVEIGRNASTLFEEVSHANALWKWIGGLCEEKTIAKKVETIS